MITNDSDADIDIAPIAATEGESFDDDGDSFDTDSDFDTDGFDGGDW